MKHFKIEFGFGVGLDRNHKRLSAVEVNRGLKTVRYEATRLFDGFTEYQTVGGWIAPDGTNFREKGRTIVVLLPLEGGITEAEVRLQAESVLKLANCIKSSLHQRAVYVTRTEVDSDLI